MVVRFTTTREISAYHHYSSNPVHGEVYSIQHYAIKFVSDFRQVGGFLRVHVDLLLLANKADFLQGLIKNKDRKLAHIFNSIFRYMDHVLSL